MTAPKLFAFNPANIVRQLTIPGTPTPKARPRFIASRRGARTYTPEETTNAEQLIISLVKSHWPRDELIGPHALLASFIFRHPRLTKATTARHAAGELDAHGVKPDLDNLLKLLMDGLEAAGVFAVGDQQIDTAICSKFYGSPPRTELAIYRFADS